MSELKCCNLCGAFYTCKNKGECCPECEYFDSIDSVCMAVKGSKKVQVKPVSNEQNGDVDPETFLFDDDEEDDDTEPTDDKVEDDEWD